MTGHIAHTISGDGDKSKYTNTEVDISPSHLSGYDDSILIPQYISRRAFYSATGFILPNCIVAYTFDYTFMFVVFIMLYISTMLHWNKVKRDGPIRIADIILAITSLYRFTFIDRFRLCPAYQTYWLYIYYIMIFAFIINEYILYMQVKRGEQHQTTALYPSMINHQRINLEHFRSFRPPAFSLYKVYSSWPLRVLNYTHPHTKERENAYYRSTYVHMFFFHVLPMATSGSFAILSYYQCPAPGA